jgi:hypothetical protein
MMGPAYALWFRRAADMLQMTGLQPEPWQWRVYYLQLRGATFIQVTREVLTRVPIA